MRATVVICMLCAVVGSVAFAIYSYLNRLSPDLTKPQTQIVLKGFRDDSPIVGISIPDGFEYDRAEGEDFLVHYFFSERTGSSIGIYVGHHPNPFIEGTPVESDGRIGDRDVRWRSERADGRYFAETFLDMYLNPGPGYRGEILIDSRLLHFFVIARKPADLDALKHFCSTTTLLRPGLFNRGEQSAAGDAGLMPVTEVRTKIVDSTLGWGAYAAAPAFFNALGIDEDPIAVDPASRTITLSYGGRSTSGT